MLRDEKNKGNYPLAVGSREEYDTPTFSEEEIDVTVCVAAMFSMPDKSVGILGASDRMLTVPPDIQYEPHQQPKIYHLTNSIQIMTSGDSGLQAEVLQEVTAEAYRRVDAETRWLTVKEIAELYSETYEAKRRKQSDLDVLKPLGLDLDTWIYSQSSLEPSLARDIAKELYNYRIGDVSAIIAGVDPSGAHIYVVRNSSVTCNDKVGFAAIGIGKNHAGSELMFAGHSRHKPYPETLLLVHRAKKRAEAAPGVGKVTDMFFVGPLIGSGERIPPAMIEYLDEIFEETEEEKRKINTGAEGKINDFFNDLRAQLEEKEKQRQEEQKGLGTGQPANTEDVRNESPEGEQAARDEPAS